MLKKVNNALVKGFEFLTFILIFLLIVLVFFQVINRLIFKLVVPWTEEFSRYLFVWCSIAGATVCTAKLEHVTVDLFPSLWPGKVTESMTFIANIITLVFYVIMTIFGMKYALKMRGNFAQTLPIEFFYIYLILPICFGLMTIFQVDHLIDFAKHLFSKKKEDENT